VNRRWRFVGVTAGFVLALGCAAGCTAILGDFSSGAADGGSTDSGSLDVSQGGPDANGDQHAGSDSSLDGGTSDADACGTGCVVAATAGNYHTCAFFGDGTVSCWGDDTWAELGDNVYEPDGGFPDPSTSTSMPSPVNGLTGVTAISAGSYFTCAIAQGGKVFCWGLDDQGQCGDGNSRASASAPALVVGHPTQVPGITTAAEIHARGAAVCVRLADDSMTCWGQNGASNLGSVSPAANQMCYPVSGNPANPCTPTPQPSLPGARFSTFTVGEYNTCGISVGTPPTVECWGDNEYGQLGVILDAGPTQSATPVNVSLPTTAVALIAGFSHTCATLSDGTLYCWGGGLDGELGDGLATSEPTPVETLLPPATTVTSMAAGIVNTCVSLNDGTVACSGSDYSDADGFVAMDNCPSSLIGFPTCALSMKRVMSLTGVKDVVFGVIHGCAITSAGALYCWGDTSFGEVGNGVSPDAGAGAAQLVPVKVTF
jgi:hypothetical protein